MKLFITAAALVALNAMAFNAKDLSAKAMEKGKNAFSACKHEQVEFCKEHKKMDEIKTCLVKNKDKLSANCKSSIGL